MFWIECTCVFKRVESAFIFCNWGGLQGNMSVFFSNFVKTIESYENKIVDCPVRPAFVFGWKFLCGASSCT